MNKLRNAFLRFCDRMERLGNSIEELRYFDYPNGRVTATIDCDCGHRGRVEARTYSSRLVVWDCPACYTRFSAAEPAEIA